MHLFDHLVARWRTVNRFEVGVEDGVSAQVLFLFCGGAEVDGDDGGDDNEGEAEAKLHEDGEDAEPEASADD